MVEALLTAWAAWALWIAACYCVPLRWLMPHAERRGNVWVTASMQPYALVIRRHVVVSHGALRLLDAEEILAVLEHERCHARERHSLLMAAWRAAFPLLPSSWLSRWCERRADEAARDVAGPAALTQALRKMHTTDGPRHPPTAGR